MTAYGCQRPAGRTATIRDLQDLGDQDIYVIMNYGGEEDDPIPVTQVEATSSGIMLHVDLDDGEAEKDYHRACAALVATLANRKDNHPAHQAARQLLKDHDQ